MYYKDVLVASVCLPTSRVVCRDTDGKLLRPQRQKSMLKSLAVPVNTTNNRRSETEFARSNDMYWTCLVIYTHMTVTINNVESNYPIALAVTLDIHSSAVGEGSLVDVVTNIKWDDSFKKQKSSVLGLLSCSRTLPQTAGPIQTCTISSNISQHLNISLVRVVAFFLITHCYTIVFMTYFY